MLDALVNMPNPPPDDTPKGPMAAPVVQQNGTATIEEPEIKPLVDDDASATSSGDETPQTAPDGTEKAKPDDKAKGDEEVPAESPFDTLESRMRQSPPDKKAAPKTEAKPATDAKPAEDAAKPDASKAAERDKDLPQLSPQAHPKTAKVFRDLTAKAVAARDERDQATAKAQAELTALQQQVSELTAKVSAAPKVEIPKEIETELATLREKVREFDITADPQLQTKYDAPQKQNNDAILGILKGHKFGFSREKPDDPNSPLVENPQAIPNLLKAGLTYDNLQQSIDTLKKAGLHADARKIERYLDANETLQEQKAREITDWKGNFESRRQMSDLQAKKAQEAHAETVRKVTEQHITAATDEIAKAFPYLKAPPAPLATDQPAIAKAKQEALDAFNQAAQKAQDDIKTFSTENLKPEEVPNLIGRVTAAAITSALLRHQVLPKAQKEIATQAARIKELEAQLEARENAGKLSRLQVGGNEAAAHQPKYESLEDAFKSAVPGSAQG